MSSHSSPPLPGAGYNLQDTQVVTDLLLKAAEANLTSPLRQGSCAVLSAPGQVVMSGDLHDNVSNLLRLLKLANLGGNPGHHLILHEVIHGPNRVNNMDLSIRTLARIAALKLRYPTQVHILLGNHELSQLRGDGILKLGMNVVAAFDEGMEYIYGDGATNVRMAMREFVRSLLLAVRCPNGLFCSHSLPSPRQVPTFDLAVLDRVPTEEDLAPGGAAHSLVWGRNHTPEMAEDLAQKLGVKAFLMGHQPAEMGYQMESGQMLILASDHEHGVGLPFDLGQEYTILQLVELLVPLGGVEV